MDAQNNTQPSVWADFAEELRKIANDCEHLVDQPAPGLISLNIQTFTPDRTGPDLPKSRRTVEAAVDAASFALLGRMGETEPVGVSFHHGASGDRGPISLNVYQSIADPALVDPDEEIARLRAENEALRAQLDQPATCIVTDCTRNSGHLGEHNIVDPTGLTYGRGDEADDPTPVSPARVPLHTGGMTDDGLVDETEKLTDAPITESCVITGWGELCTTHQARHIASGEAECGCPVYPFAGRGDAADTIVDHCQGCEKAPR